MRILVLGGTGFIGPYVVTLLSEMGHDVTVFHSGQHEVDLPTQVKHFHGNAQPSPGLGAQVAGFVEEFRHLSPEVVLYMLPLGAMDAQAVATSFRGVARRLVAISSMDVYRAYGRFQGSEPGPVDPVPLGEDSPLREKLYPYRGPTPRAKDDPQRWMDDYDKILVERAVMGDADLVGTVLRLPMVYGPRDRQHRLFPHLKRMDDQRPAILMDEEVAGWRWSRGYVENVAAAIALAVADERAAGRIYNVPETDASTEAEWVQEIGRIAGWSGKVVIVPRDRLPEHLKQPFNADQPLVSDTNRMRSELGYLELVHREEALKRTIRWERAHPPETADPAQLDYAAEDVVLAELWQEG